MSTVSLIRTKQYHPCRVCGIRRNSFIEIDHPENAETGYHLTELIIICTVCAGLIGRVAGGTVSEHVETESPRYHPHQKRQKQSPSVAPMLEPTA